MFRADSVSLHSGLNVDLSELISRHTPVFIRSYGKGGLATAHFRGTAASHTGVIWNGMPLNSPMRGTTDLSQLPLFFVDNLLVLPGGSSLTVASGALGGIIFLENQPEWQVNAIKLSLERGSFNTMRTMAKVQWGRSKFQTVTRIFLEKSENNYPFFNNGVLPHRRDTLFNGDFGKKALLQELYFRTGNGLTFHARGWIQQNDRNFPPLMSYEGDARTEFQKDDQYRLNAGLKKFTGKLSYQYTAGWNHARMDYFHQSKTHQYILRDAQSREESWSNQFRIQYRLPRLVLTASADAAWVTVNSEEKVKMEGYEKRRGETGWMLQGQYQTSGRSGLYLIYRGEWYDGEFIPLIPSAGGEWKVLETFPLTMKMNVTRNYHKPGLNDLYWNPGGNPELLPEEGFTGEIMLSAAGKKETNFLNQEISLYFSDIRNWIMWQPAANGAWYWEATNIDLVRAYGAEYNFSSMLQSGNWKFVSSGNYAYTRAFRPHALSGPGSSGRSQLIYLPVHAANLHLAVSLKTWSLLGDLSFTGQRLTQMSDPQRPDGLTLPPFGLLNTSLQKHFSGKNLEWGIKWKVENLLNARYQQILWRPMPERNYSLTLTLAIKK